VEESRERERERESKEVSINRLGLSVSLRGWLRVNKCMNEAAFIQAPWANNNWETLLQISTEEGKLGLINKLTI
jgi:hypothetical protein